MTFANCCVGFVIFLFILIGTWLPGFLFNDDDWEAVYCDAWLTSSLGFAICLTIILYQNGIL